MGDPNIAIAILLGSFAVMIICKLPITFALISSTMLTMFYLGMPPVAMVQQMAKAIDSFSLMAVPFFIFAGEIMGEGGISRRIVKFADVCVGRVRGGLAQVNCLDSMFFGGISGSAVADVSSLGAVMIPMMEENGYDKDFAVGITVTSACQGVLIPPSHNMIMFSLAAGGVSVGRLFLGGVIPGILVGLSLMVVSAIFAIKRNYPKGKNTHGVKHFPSRGTRCLPSAQPLSLWAALFWAGLPQQKVPRLLASMRSSSALAAIAS